MKLNWYLYCPCCFKKTDHELESQNNALGKIIEYHYKCSGCKKDGKDFVMKTHWDYWVSQQKVYQTFK